MQYSLIVPVYNRPNEVKELLDSLLLQTYRSFEVIIVEDGSEITCKDIVEEYADKLVLHYFFKPNSGPSDSRNYGVAKSKGDYIIIIDSDVILPTHYFETLHGLTSTQEVDVFGGPDCSHDSFTNIQKAISYSMTSFFTTGGIRGGKKKLDKFYPRSYNMGVKREVYQSLGGFSNMRFGEDIDFSIRVFQGGYVCRCFPELWVYHKRRTDLKKFFKQVYNSGIARIDLYKKYPYTLKIVHLLPMAFTLSFLFSIMVSFFFPYFLFLFLVYALLIFTDSLLKNRNLVVAFYSIFSSFVQLIGYGCGFIGAWWNRCVLGKKRYEAFRKNFYK